MDVTTLVLQRRLRALGYDPGPIDGIDGPKTQAALRKYREAYGGDTPHGVPDLDDFVPIAWMPAARMDRIIVHWTAGAHKASKLDREHYHILIEADGKLVRGIPSILLNEAPAKKGYAAHTLNCNTGSIGVSLCCMAGALESPFKAGSAPMTRVQWESLPKVLAALCVRYGVPVTPKTVLSHAEVQTNLGIKQRGKWDIARLAFDPTVVGAKACGDIFRAETKALL
jgi:N-acetyl-anhydromuramyl-L-alanine amidase AmpD